MAKGENIFKRKDGRWEARYIKGYELSGKAHYGFCYGKTYREAKNKAIVAKAALLEGRPIQNVGLKRRFSFFCDEWMNANKIKFKASTYEKYSNMLRNHIKPMIGDCYPSAVNNSTISTFTDKLLYNDELAPKTVRDILVLLNSVLKYTSKHFPGIFPPTDIRYPKEIKKEMRVLTKEEQTRLIHYLNTDMDNCKFGILLALLTGIRIGELCALRWENISLKDNTVKISATMQRLKDIDGNNQTKTKIIIGSPKSESSVRTIPLNNATAELCRKMKSKLQSDFILTGTRQYMEPRTLQYRLERYTHDCNLEGVHFHTLRHTFATRCVEAGFEIKSLSEILGHANTSITLNRYVHSSLELKRSNMNKLVMLNL